MTAAPQIAAPTGTLNPHQFYTPLGPVDRLGLIDPSFAPLGPGTSLANRFIPFLWIKNGSPGAPNAQVAIVDVDEPTKVQEVIRPLAGETDVYLRNIYLPQGSALSIRGLTATNGPMTVRLYVQFVNTTDEAAVVASLAGVEQGFGAYRTIYVGKTGADSNDGRTPATAKQTITAALATASELAPSANDRVVVTILDAGVYVEDVAGVQHVELSGPFAKVTGAITLPPSFTLRLREVEKSGGGIALTRTGTDGTAFVFLERLVCNDTALGLICLGVDNVLIAEIQQIFVEDGIGVGDASTERAISTSRRRIFI